MLNTCTDVADTHVHLCITIGITKKLMYDHCLLLLCTVSNNRAIIIITHTVIHDGNNQSQ